MLQSARESQLMTSLRIDSALGFRRNGILLIDDDAAFCLLMQTVSDARGIPMTTICALDQLPSLGALANYDLVIVDYNLEEFTGLDVAEYVDAFLGNLPVMMVSVQNLENGSSDSWPFSIRRFVNKAFGPFAIVQRALKVVDESHCEQHSPAVRPVSGGFSGLLVH